MAALRRARSENERIARQCANNYWQNLCQSIQTSADCGNIRAMYKRMKKAFSPCAIKTAPLKTIAGEIITDRAKQMERWAEHYQELHSSEIVVTDTAVENTSPLPVMKELDDPPTIEEFSKAIDSQASAKPRATMAFRQRSSKQAKILAFSGEHLHELLLWCWEERTSPHSTKTKAIAAIALTIAE